MHFVAAYRVVEAELPGVEAEGWGIEGERHGVAERSVGQVGRVAADGKSELPEVDTDLVGTSGVWADFEEACAVG